MELAPSPTPARPPPITLAPLTLIPFGPQPNLEKQAHAATLNEILNKQETPPENRGGGGGSLTSGRSLAFGGAKLGLGALRP